MDQIAHFWPEWWFELFTSAYRGSPPLAVFQNKYQSYKYERNTAGKSARGGDQAGWDKIPSLSKEIFVGLPLVNVSKLISGGEESD